MKLLIALGSSLISCGITATSILIPTIKSKTTQDETIDNQKKENKNSSWQIKMKWKI